MTTPVHRSDIPTAEAGENRDGLSENAVFEWRIHRDPIPLIDVLKSGRATPEAQQLVARPLEQATKSKLPKPIEFMLRERIILYYLMFMNMGSESEKAKEAVAQITGRSKKTVEATLSANREHLERLRHEIYASEASLKPES